MSLLENISKKRVLVVGDAILDKSIWCETIGLSLESPTLKTKEISVEIAYGGAGNVVKNLLSLGSSCTFLTLLGDDEHLRHYEEWTHPSLRVVPLVTNRKNVVKSRYWIERGSVKYKYLQVNRGDKDQLNEQEFEKMLSLYRQNLKNIDVILFVDYNNGIFTDPDQTREFVIAAQRLNIPTIASSQISDNSNRYFYFEGASYMCMNETEAISNLKQFNPENESIFDLVSILKSSICVTLGDKGSIFSDGKTICRTVAPNVPVRDTCGAGDSFLAAFATCLDDNNLKFCNMWAALATTKFGTTSPELEDLRGISY